MMKRLYAIKNEAKVFDLDNPDMKVFAKFPKWIQEKLQKNLEYQGSKLQAAIEGKTVPTAKEEPPQAPQGDDDKPWD